MVTSGVIGHRLYFHPSQLTHNYLKFGQDGIMVKCTSAILFFNFMRGKMDIFLTYFGIANIVMAVLENKQRVTS